MDNSEIGRRLRELREKAGKSRDALAYEAGVSTSTVLRYEGGKSMKMSSLGALARTLGVSMDDLWNGNASSGSDVRLPYRSIPAEAA